MSCSLATLATVSVAALAALWQPRLAGPWQAGLEELVQATTSSASQQGDPWITRTKFVRRLGTTPLADVSLYRNVSLQREQLEEFFRDGVTVLRGVLPRDVVTALYNGTPGFMRVTGGFLNNWWMMDDHVLDFLVYSNLGSLAAQVFASPGTETSKAAPEAFFLKDFLHDRNAYWGRALAWHTDTSECDGDVPANYTARAKVRFIIPLGDGLHGTLVVNQSAYVAGMDPSEVAAYWEGRLPLRACGTHCGHFDWGEVPALPRMQLSPQSATIRPGILRAGDVVMLSSCAWHRSPTPYGRDDRVGRGVDLILEPCYAPASSRVREPKHGDCMHDLPTEAHITGSPTCFPQAFPSSARPSQGSVFEFWRSWPAEGGAEQ